MSTQESRQNLFHLWFVFLVDISLSSVLAGCVLVAGILWVQFVLPLSPASSLFAGIAVLASWFIAALGILVHEGAHYMTAYLLDLRPRFGRRFLGLPTAVSYEKIASKPKFMITALSPLGAGLVIVASAMVMLVSYPSLPTLVASVLVGVIGIVTIFGASHDVMWVYAVYQRGWTLLEEHPRGDAFRPAGTSVWWTTQPSSSIQRWWEKMKETLFGL